jgi:hypothetical protein
MRLAEDLPDLQVKKVIGINGLECWWLNIYRIDGSQRLKYPP